MNTRPPYRTDSPRGTGRGTRTTGVGVANGVVAWRLCAGVVTLAFIGFLGLKVTGALFEDEEAKFEALIGADQPDQHVRVRAIEATRLRLEADGAVIFDGVLHAGTIVEAAGHDRVVIDSSDLSRIRVSYNGESVDPLGNQSVGRRLVFIDDIAR